MFRRSFLTEIGFSQRPRGNRDIFLGRCLIEWWVDYRLGLKCLWMISEGKCRLMIYWYESRMMINWYEI